MPFLEGGIIMFTISDMLLPYFSQVANSKKIPFKVYGNRVDCNVSGCKFHKLIVEALCLKQELSYKIPHGVLPYDKWIKPSERKKKEKQYGGRPVALLKRDYDKIQIASHYNVDLNELNEKYRKKLIQNTSVYHYVNMMDAIKDVKLSNNFTEDEDDIFIVSKTYKHPIGYGVIDGKFQEKLYHFSVVFKNGNVETAFPE